MAYYNEQTNPFNELAVTTMPPVLEGDSYEAVLRNAVFVGADTDTIACIAGSIAEALYPVPGAILKEALKKLPPNFMDTIKAFNARFPAD